MSIFKRKHSYNSNNPIDSTPINSVSMQESKPEGGTIRVLCTSEVRYSTATFGHGTVCCQSSSGSSFVVGYYEKEGNHCNAQCEFDRAVIGQIWVENDNATRFVVSLSRKGLYERAIKQGLHPLYPSPESEIIALSKISGIIEDFETYETLATFTGDAAEAAAAFVTLLYEALPDTKYSKFWRT